MNTTHDEEKKTPGLRQIVGSVFAAAFGVQSSKNQERDFKHGKARVFIISGIVFTLLFMGTVFTVVRLVLRQAGY
jgi:hypothetical protein